MKGSGPEGRIQADDVKAYVPGSVPVTVSVAPPSAPVTRAPHSPPAPAVGEFTDIPLTNIRQVFYHIHFAVVCCKHCSNVGNVKFGIRIQY